LHYKAVKERL